MKEIPCALLTAKKKVAGATGRCASFIDYICEDCSRYFKGKERAFGNGLVYSIEGIVRGLDYYTHCL